MNYIHPFMLLDGDREAMEQRFDEGTFNDSLASAAQYEEGDLVEVVTGTVTKSVRTDAALITKLFLAGQSYDQPFALAYFRGRGVPLNVIPKKNLFVFTYQDDAIDTADHEFAAADLQAVLAGAERELEYNVERECYTIRDGDTNPTVQLVGIFKGEVGDDNVQVIARILDERLGS